MNKIKTVFKEIVKLLRLYKKYYAYSTLPIKNNKIIFWSFRGKAYSCNPKYITKYFIDNGLIKHYDIVWAFINPDSYKFLENKGIRVIEYLSEDFVKELSTSHFIITNTRMGFELYKRKTQIYIQTWHGTMALKSIEADAKTHLNSYYIMNAKNDSKKTDVIISGCKMASCIIKKSFWYSGEIMECGNPRNDLFFLTGRAKSIIYNKYCIDKEKQIILYAPTFRSTGDTTVYNLDYERVLTVMKKRFGHEYVLMFRLHPNLRCISNNTLQPENSIDVSNYDDMQELLAASDILITDFSSSMFDCIIMKKKCFLYASDFHNYLLKERLLYFDIEKELPFPLATSNDQFVRNVEDFDELGYIRKIDMFSHRLGLFEDGNSSKRIYEYIKKFSLIRY